MSKITLDRDTFKALASDTRLDILRSLDGKKMSLKDISEVTKLNKATLHEHLTKLNEAGLVKRKEREGHKWVYYKLTWKGESLLHPENTKIVVLFSTTFVALWMGVIHLLWYVKGTMTNLTYDSLVQYNKFYWEDGTGAATNETTVPSYLGGGDNMIGDHSRVILDKTESGINILIQDPLFLYIAVACFIIFCVILCISLWRFWKNSTPKL
jgi:DNA-binding transcriptional ArsR family regulator